MKAFLKRQRCRSALPVLLIVFGLTQYLSASEHVKKAKPSPDKVITILRDGNKRFVSGKSIHPNTDAARLKQAGSENQGDYAIATVITCSDSRVPVERIFDSGIMDIFVIRVAGNVIKEDEAGSIEYGLAHVNTPVLVVLGHTQCGAVTAVVNELEGNKHKLERNIPGLIKPIIPAVKKTRKAHSDKPGEDLVPFAVEENVWQAFEDLFMESPATRKLLKQGKVKALGAVYNVSTGKVNWLPEEKVRSILEKVEKNPKKAENIYAE